MDAINTIVVNNAGNVVNANSVMNQAIGTADFMAAFTAALQGQQMVNADGQTVDFAQLVAANAEDNGEEVVIQQMLAETVMPEIKTANAENLVEAKTMVETMTADLPVATEGQQNTASATETNGVNIETVNAEVAKTEMVKAEIPMAETNGTTVVEKNENFAENNELSAEIAKNLIMTGNAKDFSAGYLSLISQSENAVDLQTILSSVGTLNGSVTQSLGLMNALENNGISQYLGLSGDINNAQTLSAEQLVMLSTLSGNSKSNNSLVELLLDENFGGTGNLDNLGLTALLGGFSDYSADDLLGMMSGTGGISSVLSAFSDDEDDNDGSLGLNSFMSNNLLSGVLGSDNNDNELAIPLSSVVPMDALKQLANVEQKQQIENIQALAKAFENGEATVTKTTEFVLADDGKTSAVMPEMIENPQSLTTDDNAHHNEFSQAEMMVGESNFTNAVREAKKNLANGKTAEIEAVVQTVSPSQVEMETVNSQKKIDEITRISNNEIEAESVLRQTAERISSKLSQRYEVVETFSVKLTPEGLGEVVVNLEKTEEGVVLNLVANESHTADLLNSKMNELQTALSQFNAQVAEIRVSETNESHTESFLQQDLSQQYQQNQGGYREGSKRHARAQETIAQQAVDVAELVYRDNSAINTYI